MTGWIDLPFKVKSLGAKHCVAQGLNDCTWIGQCDGREELLRKYVEPAMLVDPRNE